MLGSGAGKDNPVPELRTAEYYKKRPCVELVGMAADIMDIYIKDNQKDVANKKQWRQCDSIVFFELALHCFF